MIRRTLARPLREAARQYPVVTVTGPRQSGKTTLCRQVFPRKPYVSLEPLDVRRAVKEDPRGFLAEHQRGAIIDEVQHVPELLSYLQVEVDERSDAGRFVLTGSQHFGLSTTIAQSLAGRTAVLHLLPPSLDELQRFEHPPTDLLTTLWTGAYPRIHDRHIPANRWLADYVTTYVQRDVRDVLHVGDLEVFSTFLRLVAGRTAQEVNLSVLGSDAGVVHNTARAWLSVLEASWLCIRLPAWHRNVRKQAVKAPKLHLLDSGLACHLLGIRDPDQLRHHPLRGPIFESWVASEIYKACVHDGSPARLAHYRDAKRLEVDVVVELAEILALVEAKSAATVTTEMLAPLRALSEILRAHREHRDIEARLVHGGDAAGRRSGVRLVPWRDVPKLAWS
ncbi:MAG: ATP-binding protein [Deltaproteobacteria bacterium]|nr:ATP-binding protein [Deltaproteobacteria bacterium]